MTDPTWEFKNFAMISHDKGFNNNSRSQDHTRSLNTRTRQEFSDISGKTKYIFYYFHKRLTVFQGMCFNWLCFQVATKVWHWKQSLDLSLVTFLKVARGFWKVAKYRDNVTNLSNCALILTTSHLHTWPCLSLHYLLWSNLSKFVWRWGNAYKKDCW